MKPDSGSDSWKVGSLQRQLTPIRLANFNMTAGVGSDQLFRIIVQGLTSALTVHIACAIVARDQGAPIESTDYPATPGTMQLVPVVKPGEGNRAYLRPVFQDPTATDNKNHPLAQDIPFGWSFEPEGANEVQVDVVIPIAGYVGTDLIGVLEVLVTVEYTGTWMDPVAFAYNMSQPRMIGDVDDLVTIATGGE